MRIESPLNLRPGAELRVYEDRMQRQLYQYEQSRRREQERLTVQPAPRLDTPIVRPTCRVPVFGTSVPAGCR